MRHSTIIILLLFSINSYANGNTPQAVTKFYSGMIEMANVSNGNYVEELVLDMKDCFVGKYDSGANLPNDFRFFDYDSNTVSHQNETLTSNNYINKLRDYIFEDKVMTVKHQVIKNEYSGGVPDSHSGRLSTEKSLIATVVNKTYVLKGKAHIFNDTVFTSIKTGKIETICNGKGVSGVDINSLRVKAALAYAIKNYREAYRCYEQIITLDKEDGDAFYRIALMTYWQQGCTFGKKKKARNKAMEYMWEARLKGDYEIARKAKSVLYNWEYPNQ